MFTKSWKWWIDALSMHISARRNKIQQDGNERGPVDNDVDRERDYAFGKYNHGDSIPIDSCFPQLSRYMCTAYARFLRRGWRVNPPSNRQKRKWVQLWKGTSALNSLKFLAFGLKKFIGSDEKTLRGRGSRAILCVNPPRPSTPYAFLVA